MGAPVLNAAVTDKSSHEDCVEQRGVPSDTRLGYRGIFGVKLDADKVSPVA
jgi:hypothetical protein